MASCPISTDDTFPSPDRLAAATKTHVQGNFRICTRKLPISKAGPIDDMEARLRIPVPEMIFGDNMVSVTHIPTGWNICFTAYDALDTVDKTDKNMLQVSYARDWSSSRETSSADVREIVKPYDWSYTTSYAGSLDDASAARMADGREPIPIDLLKRRDPILFFDEVVLFESELDDNGISLYSEMPLSSSSLSKSTTSSKNRIGSRRFSRSMGMGSRPSAMRAADASSSEPA
ncbi:hypothetical protein TD95_001004 [Thielaviopsis punctulata]|uniref:Uncharacterized protein n=1 Tax=Thielaviopsis punctulata TaxID=72032 RepID=A0A0F4ZJT9_9PEZI|nr:hypothetical protein TD95_001004 [Thielaviopsis punctulata]